MNKPFSKTLGGKFAVRTGLFAVVIAGALAGLAIVGLRSLAGSANASASAARQNPSSDAVAELERVASDISSTSSTFTLIIAVVAVVGIVAGAALGNTFAGKITRPISRLRGATLKSAATIADIDHTETLASLDSLSELPEIKVHSDDEVEDLADSVSRLQRSATNLAVAHARKREQSAGQFVDLGLRSQALLRQQMSLIESMERDEINAENLQRLFQIDHLATRMRRTAESILVLADEASLHQLQRPVSLHQVIQAASSGIEHYGKITISDFPGVGIHGSAANDLVLLTAEVLDNATRFSPADAMTMVTGVATAHGYLVEVIDNGSGMDPQDIAHANERFARAGAVDADSNAPATVGFDLVSRLAARHQIMIELVGTTTGGLTVRLHIPQTVLADLAVHESVVATSAAPAAAPAEERDVMEAAALTVDQLQAIDLAIDNVGIRPPSEPAASLASALGGADVPAGPIDADMIASFMEDATHES